jgi:uncharacterized protein (TIGR00290 family)
LEPVRKKSGPKEKSFLSWSSGKDASFALLRLLESGIKPDLLLTTVNKDFKRVSMHGLRIELLERQAESIGIPLLKIPLDKDVSMETYNRIMHETLTRLAAQGFTKAYFGDIFLEDLKQFRIEQMQKIGMEAEFPVWGYETSQMAREIIDHDIQAVVVTVSAKKLDSSYVGREFDGRFLCDLPSDVDKCGENGEFHTFVYNAPFFKSPIDFIIGEKIYREYGKCTGNDRKNFNRNRKQTNWDTGFWYVDLIPR